MGGGAQGSQPKAEQNPYSGIQAGWADQTMNHISPFLYSVVGQANRLMRTGKSDLTDSLLGTLIEQQKTGVAKGLQASQDQLGRSRMAGTPFGQRILADQRISGAQSVASVFPNFVQWFLPQAMNFATGNQATAQQGLSSASGAEANRISSLTQAQGNYETQKASNYGQMMTKMIPSTQFSFTG